MRPFFLLLFTFSAVTSFKILVYSGPLGFSHVQFMGRIADLLHEAGHDVTFLQQVSNDKHTTFPKKAKQILLDLPQEMRVKLNPE
ncbi:hypothetical protein NECAME_12357, partial [Necator americanus]